MKKCFSLLFLLAAIFCQVLPAQNLEPIKWAHELKKLSDADYELVFTATIAPGWHLYSTDIPDGGPVSTTFNVDAISGSSVNEDSDYDLSASDYYTDISGYMTVDTVEELCAAMMGEGATDSVLALVNAFAVLFPYLIPGSERIDDAYNIQLTSGVAGASYTSNTTTEAELSGDDAAYIQSLLNETLETASRLGYDISKFETLLKMSLQTFIGDKRSNRENSFGYIATIK